MIVNREDAAATATRECQVRFLCTAADHTKVRLGHTLCEKVFKPSRRRSAELGLPVPILLSQQLTPEQYAALSAFWRLEEDLIWKWAAGHNLDYEWVHDAARLALQLEKFPPHPFAFMPGYHPPEFFWESWYEGEREEDYRKRITTGFREKLGSYIQGVKLKRREFLYHRSVRSQSSHYSWAVEYVCLRLRFSEIACHTDGKTPQAIRQAVLPILKRIGILERHNLPRAKRDAPGLSS